MLYVVAAFYNEEQWVESCVKELTEIEPDILIVYDGCFDDKFDNCSNDGTYDILLRFAESAQFPVMILRPGRWSRLSHFRYYYQQTDILKHKIGNRLIRFLRALNYSLRWNKYRLNQGRNFLEAFKLTNASVNDWIMTYDADQFYSTKQITEFGKLRNGINISVNYDSLVGTEYTYFQPQDYTTDYEKRDYNNFPLIVQHGLTIFPTRDFYLVDKIGRRKNPRQKKKHTGPYKHFKFRTNASRLELGYSLGDRKKPEQIEKLNK